MSCSNPATRGKATMELCLQSFVQSEQTMPNFEGFIRLTSTLRRFHPLKISHLPFSSELPNTSTFNSVQFLTTKITMAEQLRQRLNSEEERVLWFASLAPNQPNLNFEDFKVGLQATEEIFATIQELINQSYDNHGLDNAALLPGGPDF